MKTIKEMIIGQHLRRGPAHGTTKGGAYWCPDGRYFFARLRRVGGDGIGQSAPAVTYSLDFRHYRSGEVSAVICRDAWHQNDVYSDGKTWIEADAVLACTTIEEAVVALQGMTDGGYAVIGDTELLRNALLSLGLPLAAPAPDEAAAPAPAPAWD